VSVVAAVERGLTGLDEEVAAEWTMFAVDVEGSGF
jgi:hypothetical protein